MTTPYDETMLQFIVKTPSQYDSTCRSLAAAILEERKRVLEVIEQLKDDVNFLYSGRDDSKLMHIQGVLKDLEERLSDGGATRKPRT